MAVLKGLHPTEARRCAAESETVVWAMIIILLALTAVGGFLFVDRIAG
jgi:hypothetical protein